MTQQIGMSQQQIDEIELRLVGADHRPWILDRSVQDEKGRPCVCKGSRKSAKKLEKQLGANGKLLVDGIGSLQQRVPRHRQEMERLREQVTELRAAGLDEDAVAKIEAQIQRGIEDITEMEGKTESLAGRQQPLLAAQKQSLALFRLCDEASEDMANFVAHAPEDVEALLQEVKMIRKRYRDCEQERDTMAKELLSVRAEKATLQDKFSTQRRLWREFREAMGDKP